MPVLNAASIHPIGAVLAPDGTIVVELLTDDSDEPLVATIPPYRETIRLAHPSWARPIDLDEDGDAANLRLRGVVTEFVCRLEQRRTEIAVEQAASR